MVKSGQLSSASERNSQTFRYLLMANNFTLDIGATISYE